MKICYWNIVEQISYFESRKTQGVFYLIHQASMEEALWYAGKSPE